MGVQHACALEDSTNAPYCWGINNVSQLGLAAGPHQHHAVPASRIGPIVGTPSQLGVGYNHNCIKTNTSNTYCWGDNQLKQTGNPASSSGITAYNLTPHLPNYTIADVGIHTSCVVEGLKDIRCWGANGALSSFNYAGGLGHLAPLSSPVPLLLAAVPLPPEVTKVVKIGAGGFYTCAIVDTTTASGKILCWGNATLPWKTAPFGAGHNLAGAAALAASVSPPQLIPMYYVKTAINTDMTNAKKIETSGPSGCAIDATNDLYCWGLNSFGGQVYQIPAGTISGLASKIAAPYGQNVKKFAMADAALCVLNTSGKVFCSGRNNYGQLGNGGALSGALTPFAPVVGLPAIVADISGKNSRSICALGSDKTVWCWGQNDKGQLGDCTVTTSGKSSPVQVMKSCTPPPQNINGACNTTTMGGTFSHPGPSATPPTNLCATGTPSAVTQQTVTPYNWLWTCAGTGTGTTASCNARNVPGKCGSADMGSFNSSSIPAASALCATGNPIAAPVSSGGTWTWSCSGAPVVSCSAKDDSLPPTNGVCGPGSGPPVDASIAAIPTPYCTSGTPSPSVLINTTPTWVPWSCVGANGGTTVQCGTKILAPTPKIGVFPSAGTGCSISPSTNTSLGPGMTATFTATAATGYFVGTTTGTCPGLPTLTNPVTIGPINTNCTIKANCYNCNPENGPVSSYCVANPVEEIKLLKRR